MLQLKKLPQTLHSRQQTLPYDMQQLVPCLEHPLQQLRLHHRLQTLQQLRLHHRLQTLQQHDSKATRRHLQHQLPPRPPTSESQRTLTPNANVGAPNAWSKSAAAWDVLAGLSRRRRRATQPTRP
jgi:hypothetical protein